MVILLKKATIVDPRSKYHGKKQDILIEKGIITKIANSISSKKAKIVDGKNLHVSPGWVDIGVHTGEPGLEHRDTLESTLATASAGGFTRIGLFSNDASPIDQAATIGFIKDRSSKSPVHCHTIGALSQKLQGEEITEVIDMHHAGSIGFSDGLHSIQKAGLLERALHYVKAIDSIVIHRPNDKTLSLHSQMHEGKVSTSLGIPGMPDIAESIMIDRDIEILKYTDSKMLIHLVSTQKGINHLKKEKKSLENKLFASVSYHNLIDTDETLADFDVNRKLSPPLRSSADKNALIKAVESDLIDVICSNHVPIEIEGKEKEFIYADKGALGMQTCGPALLEFLDASTIVEKMAINPRKIFNLPPAEIAKGEEAELTIWANKTEHSFTQKENKSRSRNSPFFGKKFNNKIVAIVSKDQLILSQ